MIVFLARSLSELHKPPLSNVTPYPLYTYFSLSLFSTTLVAPNKQFLNLKLFVRFLGPATKSEQINIYNFGPVIVLFYS